MLNNKRGDIMNDLGNKEVMAQNIQRQMDDRGLTRNDFCNILSVPYTTLTDWVTAKKYPRIDKIEQMANYFGINKADLVEEHVDKAYSNIYPVEKKKVPMLGEIACGTPIYCNEDRESYVMVGADLPVDFCLVCRGDSMIDARVYDGDIVFVQKDAYISDGDIVVAVIEDEATLKRIYRQPGKLTLAPANFKYAPVTFVGGEIDDIHILGKAIAFQSDLQ